MAYLKIPRRNVMRVYEFLNIKACSYTNSSSKDLFDVLEEKVEEDIGYDQWINNTKEALKTSKGRFWLGKVSPFPYNSSFIPKPVLSDASKTRIFELFKQNSTLNDQRILAHKFKVSIDRVKAIVRQKELELELAKQGKTVDKNFISALESNLDCVESADEHAENKSIDKKLPFRPLFVCVQEGHAFNFQDSKNALASVGINIKSPYVYSKPQSDNIIDQSTTKNSKIISKSAFETSRSRFIFVNTSKSSRESDNIAIVRDCDGTLRTANLKESDYALNKTWNRNRPSLK